MLRYERIKFELAIPPTARQFLQAHSVAYPAKLLPGYPMPTPPPAVSSDTWPFFCPNPQQQNLSSMVLIPNQTAPATVDSYQVNNLIMASQQQPQSLMTSDELNRRVDQQIKQHCFLLDEPTNSSMKKKNVCFNDTSFVRRYSVDDLEVDRPTTPLKSCLKPTKDDIQKTRPQSAVITHDIYRSSTVPLPIEHWRARQLKSAPCKLL